MNEKHKNNRSPVLLQLNRIQHFAELKIPNSRFNSKSTNSKLSGYEPKYDPLKWNDNLRVKSTHNCYAYVLNKISSLKGKPQPGYFAGYKQLQLVDYNCNTFLQRLKKDNPLLYKSTFQQPCEPGYHKGFLALDPKQHDTDYHFYRQSPDGSWSHKPGKTDVTRLDASNKIIHAPHLSNRNYKYYKYQKPCFYFCVNSKFTRSHSKQS
jgi:hypothetical protein